MNRDRVMASAREVGLIVEPCALETLIAVWTCEAPEDTNERMRMTAGGALLTIADGYYWQTGTVEDVANYVKTLKASEQ